jgi:DNA-binding IclR family transcriptional regulator
MAQQDSFSVFLDSIKGASSSSSSDSGGPVNPETAHKILTVLKNQPHGYDVGELAKHADVDFFDFAAALQTLQKLGAVDVQGQGSAQVARLGDRWQDVASLLRLS